MTRPTADRRETAPPRLRPPDFVGIGAQKAGTTWLYRNLSQHPHVWFPPLKEVHYFDRVHSDPPAWREMTDRWLRGSAKRTLDRMQADPDASPAEISMMRLIASAPLSDEWYTSLFGFAPVGSICGEVTPAYAVLPPQGVDHLVAIAPDVRVLFLVRDPIERAWSAIRWVRNRPRDRPGPPFVSLDLDGSDTDGPGRYSGIVSRSVYSTPLRTYGARIDASRIWVGDFGQLVADPSKLLRSVCDFLELEFDERFFPQMREQVRKGPPEQIDEAIYERLKRLLEPEYDQLAEVLPELGTGWRSRHYG